MLGNLNHYTCTNLGIFLVVQGSYMTMFSRGGLIFGIINIIGNFGTVFVDQSYWMGAIASTPSASYKGYILGGEPQLHAPLRAGKSHCPSSTSSTMLRLYCNITAIQST